MSGNESGKFVSQVKRSLINLFFFLEDLGFVLHSELPICSHVYSHL